MGHLVTGLLVVIVILRVLWRRAAGAASRAVDSLNAVQKSLDVEMQTADRHRRILENKEMELRALREAHSIVGEEIRAAAREIHETNGLPDRVAGLWNKTFTEGED